MHNFMWLTTSKLIVEFGQQLDQVKINSLRFWLTTENFK